MDEYTRHMDRVNLETRLRRLANREERERQARATEEQEVGLITLWMPKRELQARLREAYQRHAVALFSAVVTRCFHLPVGAGKAGKAQP